MSASRAPALAVDGADAGRAADFARAFLAHHHLDAGARVSIHRALPAHAGLGSGTQLALAVARALAELYGVATTATALARAVGRAQRSAIGTWTFAGGGLVVEGGRRPDGDDVGPLIARLPFPPAWHCVVAVPRRPPAISGADEAEALARLPPPADREVEQIAHLVLMAVRPAGQRRGIARRMTQWLIETAETAGVASIHLELRSPTTISRPSVARSPPSR